MIAGAGGPWRGARRPARRPARSELVEVVTPRTNAAALTPAENLFAAIALPSPSPWRSPPPATPRWFLARAGSPAMRAHIEDQLGVAYPQAELRRLDARRFPALDPARCAPDEQVAACALRLRRPPYLPLRTFTDRTPPPTGPATPPRPTPCSPSSAPWGTCPPGWRALAQLVLRPVADDWAGPTCAWRWSTPWRPSAPGPGPPRCSPSTSLVLLLLAGAGRCRAPCGTGRGVGAPRPPRRRPWPGSSPAWPGWAGAWPSPPSTTPGWCRRRSAAPPTRPTSAWPSSPRPVSTPAAVAARLQRIGAAYRQFDLASGNGLVPRPLRLPPRRASPPAARRAALDALGPLQGRALARATPDVLNTRELAGLWHLPQALADVPLLERTTARRRLPLPGDVARGCPIGVSTHLGRARPGGRPGRPPAPAPAAGGQDPPGQVLAPGAPRALPDDPPRPGRAPPALVLVDPHRDLAQAVLGLVPPGAGRTSSPSTWRIRRAPSASTCWTPAWAGAGTRRWATPWPSSGGSSTSSGARAWRTPSASPCSPSTRPTRPSARRTPARAGAAAHGAPGARRPRRRPLPAAPAAAGARPADRGLVAELLRPPRPQAAVEIINPVQTKVSRFAGSAAARAVVGQSRSTIDPAAWVREGAVVVVNTARGVVGEDTAALVGGCLINLVGLLIGEQAALPAAARQRVSVIVDEFHTMPGADYEGIVAELAKYGASLVLATQSLSRLETLDPREGGPCAPPSSATWTGCSPSTPAPRTPATWSPSWAKGWTRPTSWSWGSTAATPSSPPGGAPPRLLRAPRPAPARRPRPRRRPGGRVRPALRARPRHRRGRPGGAAGAGHPHPGPRRRWRTPSGGAASAPPQEPYPRVLRPWNPYPRGSAPGGPAHREHGATGAAPRPPGAPGAPGARSRNRPRRSRPQPAHPSGTLTLSPPTRFGALEN